MSVRSLGSGFGNVPIHGPVSVSWVWNWSSQSGPSLRQAIGYILTPNSRLRIEGVWSLQEHSGLTRKRRNGWSTTRMDIRHHWGGGESVGETGKRDKALES